MNENFPDLSQVVIASFAEALQSSEINQHGYGSPRPLLGLVMTEILAG